jgi:hypothetical protein
LDSNSSSIKNIICGKSLTDFDNEMRSNGWAVFHSALGQNEVSKMRADCLTWIKKCGDLQIQAGLNEEGDGTAHHTIGGNDSLDAFFHKHMFHDYIKKFFNGKPYIMHAANPVGGFPKATTYVHKIHRDVQIVIPNYSLRLNMLVMLDPFTLENGATEIMPNSQGLKSAPTVLEFESKSVSILGEAGTVVLFDSYLWHRAGFNSTLNPRVAFTLSFNPAFIKPQLDYARMLGEDRGSYYSALSRQVLGYNSRVPINLTEWYRPKEARLYQPDQD